MIEPNDIFPFTEAWDARNPMYIGVATQTHQPTRKMPWTGFVMEWIVAGCGFGEISFHKRVGDDFWYIHDEYMGKEFVFDLIAAWLERNPKRRHGSSRRWTKRLLNHQEVLRRILSGEEKVFISSDRVGLAYSKAYSSDRSVSGDEVDSNKDGESNDND